MGNLSSIPEAHRRIYTNLLSIQSPETRVQMIQTMIQSPEHLASMKTAGVYGNLLHYAQAVQAGTTPPLLPGEQATAAKASSGTSKQQQQQLAVRKDNLSEQPNEKAMNYFSACLRMLDLEEEVALTEESLKAAYKKAVVRAHPDKGGSEREFEAVTRAYAYLGDILRRIKGGRSKEGKVEAPEVLTNGRTQEAEAWKHVEPIHLNPKKLDLNAFNQMFEKTRIPDPEEGGYEEWLKSEGTQDSSAPAFSGKFNRDVFHKAFQDHTSSRVKQQGGALVAQEQSLANRLGYATELGRGFRDDYTAANDDRLQYTDLKKAYTEYNVFSHNVADVRVENRSMEQLTQERKNAPGPLVDYELQALQQAEQAAQRAEEQRKMRLAQQQEAEDTWFKRMQRLVIRNE